MLFHDNAQSHAFKISLLIKYLIESYAFDILILSILSFFLGPLNIEQGTQFSSILTFLYTLFNILDKQDCETQLDISSLSMYFIKQKIFHR